MSFVHCSMTPLECDAQWRFIAHALTYFVTVKKIMTRHVVYQCSLSARCSLRSNKHGHDTEMGSVLSAFSTT